VRVAFTLEQCWHPVPGGTAVAALELARALDARGEVELVGVAARHRSAPPEPWRPPIRVAQLPLPRLALYEVWHRLRRPSVERATGAVDVIHATGIAMPPATRPIVSTVHDLAYLDYPEMFSRAGLRFFRRALELTLADARLVLCSSLATLARCRAAGFDEARLRHVPLGVRVDPASEERVRAVRTRFGLDGDYVLWTGTVEPRKNLPGLLRAFALVEPAVDLALVGPSGWNEDLERVLDSLPATVRARVHRLGWVVRDDLAALYAGASVFCFPSLLEGFGFPVVEAMAHGTPVVTSTGTSTEELVEDGAGLAVAPTDTDAIAAAISRVLKDETLAARLAAVGAERAAEYTLERMAALVERAYAEATGASVAA
jgi:glycosyltransferase involved in cell wall biosynthesis